MKDEIKELLLSKKYKDNELKMHIKSKLYQKGFDAGEISDLLSRL